MSEQTPAFPAPLRAILGSRAGRMASWAALTAPVDTSSLLTALADRSPAERQALLAELQANAQPLHLQVHVVSSRQDLTDCLAALVRTCAVEFALRKEIILHDHPLLRALPLAAALADDPIAIHWTRHGESTVRRHTIEATAGITVADLAIAESATIAQVTRPGQPRSTSLVPSVHIAILTLDTLVATFAEAQALLRHHGQEDSSMVLISGPSKTADIEACMVHGAHGPRAMHLLVLTEDTPCS